ncbi:cell wall hydrolase [Fuchsiella alkaliacetigena]|uniref:cell wall hydrolase n=1 Tax=Fuchsiella alkaliacetigena TaxID=957042 RepID=UPI00200B95A8|nr:cell wall hydrolase [Fuchsiella alkaliacetigena]MCK8823813.1 cell wall hydrolase [Fuchsiella alkaliacetigena]
MGRLIEKRIIVYLLIVSLLVPFMTGFLLVDTAWALERDDYRNIFKGIGMIFLLSLLGRSSDAEADIPADDGLTDSSGEDSTDTDYEETIPDEKEEDDSSSEEIPVYYRYNAGQRELETLARAVYSEARGESYKGQVAVAAVVLNRVDSNEFPNTIDGVVYQRTNGAYAFSAVLDGQINLTPNQMAYDAAEDALRGWDPSGGALYYYNPRTATASWIFENTEPIKTIGQHLFARLRTN